PSGGSEKLLSHVGKHTQIAGGVLAESIFERFGDELWGAGMVEDMLEEVSEVIGVQRTDRQARSDATAWAHP
ncbi:MAG: hypothetical protein ABIE42_12045, partial [Candidatus Eisenbacteria bacterium]